MPTILIVIIVIVLLILFAQWANKKEAQFEKKEKKNNPLLAYYKRSMEIYKEQQKKGYRNETGMTKAIAQFNEKLVALAAEYRVQPEHECVSPPPWNEKLSLGEYLSRNVGERYNMNLAGNPHTSEYPVTISGLI